MGFAFEIALQHSSHHCRFLVPEAGCFVMCLAAPFLPSPDLNQAREGFSSCSFLAKCELPSFTFSLFQGLKTAHNPLCIALVRRQVLTQLAQEGKGDL